MDDASSLETYYCEHCLPGYYTHPESKECTACVIDSCEECSSEEICTKCEYPLVPNGNRCESPDIPYCKTVNADDETYCDECHTFFSLTADHTKCVPCSLISEGCMDCALDDFDQPDECL
jgi:hypothetical protein